MGYYISVYGTCQFKNKQALEDYHAAVARDPGPSLDWDGPIHKGKGKRGNGLTYTQLAEKGWATLADLLETHELYWQKVKGKPLTYQFMYDQKDFLRWQDCLEALKPFVKWAEWECQGEDPQDRFRARIQNGRVEYAHSLWSDFR